MVTRQNSTNIDWHDYDGDDMCPGCDLCRDCGHAHEIGKTHTCYKHRREEVRFVERNGVTYTESTRPVFNFRGESLTREELRSLFLFMDRAPSSMLTPFSMRSSRYVNYPPQLITPVHDEVMYEVTADQIKAIRAGKDPPSPWDDLKEFERRWVAELAVPPEVLGIKREGRLWFNRTWDDVKKMGCFGKYKINNQVCDLCVGVAYCCRHEYPDEMK